MSCTHSLAIARGQDTCHLCGARELSPTATVASGIDIADRIKRARWWRTAWINAGDGEQTLTRKEYKEFRSRLADRRVGDCCREMNSQHQPSPQP